MLLSGLYVAFRLKLMFSLFAENPKQNSKPKYHLMKGRINEFVRQIRCNILQMKNIDFHNLPLFLQLIGRIGFAAFRPFCTLFAPGCHPFRNSCVHCLRPLVSPCGSACGSKAAASQPLLLRRNRTVTSLPHPTGSGRGSEPLRSHRTVFCGRLRRR